MVGGQGLAGLMGGGQQIAGSQGANPLAGMMAGAGGANPLEGLAGMMGGGASGAGGANPMAAMMKKRNCPACLAALVAEFNIQPRRISAIN